MSYSTKLLQIETAAISSLRRPIANETPISFSELIKSSLRRKCITYRRHGHNGGLLKPMHHRFEVKGGHSNIEALAQNVTRSNPLFERLSKR